MSKEAKQIPDRHRVNAAPQVVSGASLAVPIVPGSQPRSQPTDKGDTKVEVSPQGALPVLSVPGGTQTGSELAVKNDPNGEVSPEGALPVLSIPGGSRL